MIDFKINQDFIAEILCINRDKPILTCNGKCYLSQQLKKAEDQEEKQAPLTKMEKLELLYCFSKEPSHLLTHTTNYLSKPNLVRKNLFYSFSFMSTIFHPPKLNLI